MCLQQMLSMLTAWVWITQRGSLWQSCVVQGMGKCGASTHRAVLDKEPTHVFDICICSCSYAFLLLPGLLQCCVVV